MLRRASGPTTTDDSSLGAPCACDREAVERLPRRGARRWLPPSSSPPIRRHETASVAVARVRQASRGDSLGSRVRSVRSERSVRNGRSGRRAGGRGGGTSGGRRRRLPRVKRRVDQPAARAARAARAASAAHGAPVQEHASEKIVMPNLEDGLSVVALLGAPEGADGS